MHSLGLLLLYHMAVVYSDSSAEWFFYSIAHVGPTGHVGYTVEESLSHIQGGSNHTSHAVLKSQVDFLALTALLFAVLFYKTFTLKK